MDFAEHLKKYLSQSDIDKLISSFSSPSKNALLLNENKIDKTTFLRMFPNIEPHPIVNNGFIYKKEEYTFGKMIYHDAGVYYLQEPSAMIVSSLLKPNKNDYVLDMCAAPGGKTIQASLLMENKGLILANDLSYTRAKILSSNVERMGLKNVVVSSMDLHNMPSKFTNFFDKIILDAPCSGSGMFRKDDKMKEDWTYEKVQKCALIQAELIELAYTFLAPSGTIIYSTCSYSYEEDEEIVLNFIANHKDISFIPIEKKPYYYVSNSGIGIHLFPSLFPGEGHYICLLKKDGECKKHCLSLAKNTKEISHIFDMYNLANTQSLIVEESLYSLPINIELGKITTLRNGLKVGELHKGNFLPDYHLSHYLTNINSIELNDLQKDKYIHGDSFPIENTKDGFFVVSYNKVNLGFVKVVNGLAKNHYPKGLRH